MMRGRALGDDYRAVGLTALGRRTAVADGAALDGSGGFPFKEAAQPEPDCGEAAFSDDAPWTLVDLRAAERAVTDADSFTRMRMADYFLDQPAFASFDALGRVARTSGTAHTR